MSNYHDHNRYGSFGWIFANHAPIPIPSTMNLCCSLCPIRMYHMKPSHLVEAFVQCMHSSPHLTKATCWHNHANTKSNPKVRTLPWPPHLCPTMWACNKHMRQNLCWPTEMSKSKHAENKHETQRPALIPSIASKQQSPLLDVGRHRWGTFLCHHQLLTFLQNYHAMFPSRTKNQTQVPSIPIPSPPIVHHSGCSVHFLSPHAVEWIPHGQRHSLSHLSVAQLFCSPAVAHCGIPIPCHLWTHPKPPGHLRQGHYHSTIPPPNPLTHWPLE